MGTEQKGPPPPFRMSLFNESLCSFDAAEVDVKKKIISTVFFFLMLYAREINLARPQSCEIAVGCRLQASEANTHKTKH